MAARAWMNQVRGEHATLTGAVVRLLRLLFGRPEPAISQLKTEAMPLLPIVAPDLLLEAQGDARKHNPSLAHSIACLIACLIARSFVCLCGCSVSWREQLACSNWILENCAA